MVRLLSYAVFVQPFHEFRFSVGTAGHLNRALAAQVDISPLTQGRNLKVHFAQKRDSWSLAQADSK